MTGNQIRQKIVDTALAYMGVKEGSAEHKRIVEIFNSYTPHPRGHVLTLAEPWCAGFVSAIAITCGVTKIIPVECSCSAMIKLFKELGCWQEKDDYVPKPGDIGFFDWQDKNKGDNTGAPDHVGIVASCENGVIRFVEGNKNDMVGDRYIEVGGKYLRGFGTPDYASMATEADSADTYTLILNILRRGDKGPQVKALQRLLLSHGYRMTANGKTYGIDGDFGAATENAVRKVQSDCGWQVDGEAGPQTMGGLLGLS